MNYFIILISILLIYLLVQVYKLNKFNKSQSTVIEFLETFVNDLIRATGADEKKAIKQISKYLTTQYKHRFEFITMLVMPKSREALIDKKALAERQKKEIDEIIKNATSHNPSFPAK